MSEILNKKQMSEEDIKLQYITPALTSKWNIKKITMETQITDGKINLKGNRVTREKPKHADYVLYLSANNPVAIVEAKDNNHSVSYGLQQAMTYAQMMGRSSLNSAACSRRISLISLLWTSVTGEVRSRTATGAEFWNSSLLQHRSA